MAVAGAARTGGRSVIGAVWMLRQGRSNPAATYKTKSLEDIRHWGAIELSDPYLSVTFSASSRKSLACW